MPNCKINGCNSKISKGCNITFFRFIRFYLSFKIKMLFLLSTIKLAECHLNSQIGASGFKQSRKCRHSMKSFKRITYVNSIFHQMILSKEERRSVFCQTESLQFLQIMRKLMILCNVLTRMVI